MADDINEVTPAELDEWARAAEGFRTGEYQLDPETIHMLVADWIDAEIATINALEPMAELASIAIERGGGPAGSVKLARGERGGLLLRSDTSVNARRMVRTALGIE